MPLTKSVIGPLSSWALVLVGAVLAVALFLQESGAPASFSPSGPVGSLQTVTLTSGQVYFGRLKSVDRGEIVLVNVFEAVTSADSKTEQRTTRLVSRQTANWHGPLDMAIPAERILFTETIGPESAVGKAISASTAGK